MTFWQVVADVFTPGSPRSRQLRSELARMHTYINQLGAEHQAGAALNPSDELVVYLEEIARWS